MSFIMFVSCCESRGILQAPWRYWPMTSFTMLSCISHREFTAAKMVWCKIGATQSLLISEQACCFKCGCWDRGWDTKWTSSQEKVLFSSAQLFSSIHTSSWSARKDMRSMDLTTGATSSCFHLRSFSHGFRFSVVQNAGTYRREPYNQTQIATFKMPLFWQRKTDLTPKVHVRSVKKSSLLQPLTDTHRLCFGPLLHLDRVTLTRGGGIITGGIFTWT